LTITLDKTLTLSLISHTNVGKTTLARTLLRRDVGDVSDQEHVTIENVKYTLLEVAGGQVLRLWDTPGFGNSVRLLRRLRRQENPVGWLLNETWDRLVNRSLWCSQQAVANVRDEADVVLYLVNVTEDPEAAGYVSAEMQVLDWVGKPVIIVLNQIGQDSDSETRRQEEGRWRQQVERLGIVRDVISLDAFTRCWVQEGVLLEHVRAVLPEQKRPVLSVVLAAWLEQHQQVLAASMGHLCEHLLAAAVDSEEVTKRAARQEAQGLLADRLQRSLRTTIERLVEAHGIEGSSREAIELTETDYDTPATAIDPRKAGVVGGIISGAAGGAGCGCTCRRTVLWWWDVSGRASWRVGRRRCSGRLQQAVCRRRPARSLVARSPGSSNGRCAAAVPGCCTLWPGTRRMEGPGTLEALGRDYPAAVAVT